MRKSLVLASVLAAAIGIGLLVAFWPKSDISRRVRLAYPPIVASLPVFVAEENKLFEQKGIAAETVSFVNSNDMVNALLAGQVDGLPAVSLIPILHLEIQRPGTVRLFSHSRMTPDRAFDSIIVKNGSQMKGLGDLAGKKVGAFPGTSATNMLKHLLKQRGIDSSGTTFVPLAPPAQLSSLGSGAVDALFTYEPVTTVAQKQGKFRPLFGSVYAELLNPCPVGCSVISREFEKKHPDLAKRSIDAIDEAVNLMKADPAKAKALLPKFASVEAEIAPLVNVVDVTRSSEVRVDELQRFIDLLHEAGEIPKRIDARKMVEPTK